MLPVETHPVNVSLSAPTLLQPIGAHGPALDRLGVDDVVGRLVDSHRHVRLEVDALSGTSLHGVDGGLLVPMRDRDARMRRVGHDLEAVVDVSDAVVEHDEQLGAVIDAQPGARAAVLVDPDPHRTSLARGQGTDGTGSGSSEIVGMDRLRDPRDAFRGNQATDACSDERRTVRAGHVTEVASAHAATAAPIWCPANTHP